jgi:hypothetical protein
VEFSEIKPDALMVGTRETEITPIAGQIAETGIVSETVRLSRYDKVVALTTPEAVPASGDLSFGIEYTAEAAEVAFANLADSLRRDGWSLRDAEPWEIASPLDSEEVPF